MLAKIYAPSHNAQNVCAVAKGSTFLNAGADGTAVILCMLEHIILTMRTLKLY